MLLDRSVFDTLTDEAKKNPRLRINKDLRNSSEDKSQRMLNAMEVGTSLPIHRHRGTSETMVVLRGSLIERFYDDSGKTILEVLMSAGGECPGIQIPQGQWHNLEVIESGTVIFEAKDGCYQPLDVKDILNK